MTDELVTTRRVANTYEAAFYMMNGAEIESVMLKRIDYKKQKKQLFRKQWIIEMTGVQKADIVAWNEYSAVVNARQFEEARKKLKLKVHKALEEKYDDES